MYPSKGPPNIKKAHAAAKRPPPRLRRSPVKKEPSKDNSDLEDIKRELKMMIKQKNWLEEAVEKEKDPERQEELRADLETTGKLVEELNGKISVLDG